MFTDKVGEDNFGSLAIQKFANWSKITLRTNKINSCGLMDASSDKSTRRAQDGDGKGPTMMRDSR